MIQWICVAKAAFIHSKLEKRTLFSKSVLFCLQIVYESVDLWISMCVNGGVFV